MTSAAVVMVCLANAGAALRTNVVARTYDRFGRLVAISVDGERRTELAYDEATGRIASMRVAGEDDPFQWEYERGSDLKKSLRYPNGALVTWEYEPQRDLVTLVSNDVYSTFRYEYDEAGRRVSKNDERYEYNARGELTLATNAVTGAAFAYRYDDIGNRVWSREFGTNCTYVANELNQYTNIVRGGVSERTAFDLDGNQTNVVTATGEWAVEYNGENRPVRWTRKSDGLVITMAYDRMGRRVRKNEEVFVYDGYLNVSQTVWDPTEPVATRPLRSLGQDKSFLLHDATKNVVNAVAQMLSEEYCYALFGEEVRSSSRSLSNWRFSGEYCDEEIAVMYYNYRHYDAREGRWLSRDRNEESGGLNIYEMVANAPHELYDLLGLECSKYGKPHVIETKIDPGAWSAWDKKIVFVDAKERSIAVLPILLPLGGIIVSSVTCDCVYKIVKTRSRNIVIKERRSQTYRCEYREGCNMTSLTYEEDLGWSSRTVQEGDAKSANVSFSVRPWGGGIAGVPVDCDTPCRFSPPN